MRTSVSTELALFVAEWMLAVGCRRLDALLRSVRNALQLLERPHVFARASADAGAGWIAMNSGVTLEVVGSPQVSMGDPIATQRTHALPATTSWQ